MSSVPAKPDNNAAAEARSMWKITWRRFTRHHLAVVGGAVLILLLLMAVFAPQLAPYDYRDYDYGAFLQAPSLEHPLGTDNTGADLLSRIMFGARISLSVGFLAMLTAMILGIVIGGVAGFFGGWVDNLAMRLVDIALSIPSLFLLLILVVIVAPSTPVVIAAIGVTTWMYPARVVRGIFLSLREQEFVEAARAVGAPSGRIIVRQILPNAMGPLIVNATLMVGQAIISESVLSYLGVGIQPPTPSWGNMLADAQSYLWQAPWMAVFPGLMILITVLTFNLLGDGLRDALDPRLRQ